jgi:isopenicillin-N epimerase
LRRFQGGDGRGRFRVTIDLSAGWGPGGLRPSTQMQTMTLPTQRRSFLKALGAGAAAPLLDQFLFLEDAFAAELESLDSSSSSLPQEAVIKSRYLLDPRLTYLNHASIGTVPRVVHQAGMRYREICEENPWLYIWGGAWEEAREEVRAKAATLMGCDPGHVAITHSTTEGFNTLAQGLPLGRGDEILFSTLNHPGASICWDHFGATRGYAVRVFDFPMADVMTMSLEDVVRIHEEQIRDETRVLVFPHIDNIVGLRHPMEELAAMAHARGVEYVLVDGAQSTGMIPTDLEASGIDGFATSPHKWVQSPKGLGLLWVKPQLLEELRPLCVTWGQARWAGTGRIYEDYGTRDFPEVLSLGNALDFQAAVGESRKEVRYRAMFVAFQDAVDSSPAVAWRSPREWGMGSILTAVEVLNRPVNQVNEELYQGQGIVLRAFPGSGLNTLRVSPNLLNSMDDLQRLLTVLEARS